MKKTVKNNHQKGYWSGYWARHWILYAMLVLPIVFIFIFRYLPMVHLWRAFTPNNTILPVTQLPFIGLSNFREAFALRPFRTAIRNTLMFSGLDLLIGFPAPIILALLINELKFEKFKKITQSISYVPNFISWIIIGGLATTLLSSNAGAVNALIERWGFQSVTFLETEGSWVITNVLISVWRGVGWSSIIYLAAITNISPEFYEAAELDGASRLQKMWYITIPGISPVIATLFTLALGGVMSAELDRFVALENSFVRGVSEVISVFVWRWGLQSSQFAFATAVGLFQGIIGLTMLLLGNWFVKKIGGDGFW
jgi:ABC-type polysaccharide transport system, permease component